MRAKSPRAEVWRGLERALGDSRDLEHRAVVLGATRDTALRNDRAKDARATAANPVARALAQATGGQKLAQLGTNRRFNRASH